jgi:anti-sigma factor RsiW
MRCRTAQRRLSDALDGALPAALQARLEAHLRACPDCRAYRDRVRRLQERAALAPARPDASWAAFEAALEVRIDAQGERLRPAARRRRRVLAWAAASASLLVGLAAWWMLRRPAPVRVETWTAYADVLDPLMMAAEADADTAGRVAREVGAQIEELTPAPDLEALVLPAADPLFWEGLSEDELRGIVADLEKETAHGGPA